ncbi:MAG: 30S ribosome-binding factor RbfA [Geodermatophilaceae bacterium]|nr:30S ribosome-binding factor RbfA [Geodermatophilaceae bacterium]
MVDAARARRLAVRIREIVASTLEHQVKDPRLGMVTITDAKVTGDLREASVYYTVYGDDAEVTGSAIALESARGVLRSAVGRQTGIKFVPTLTFVSDAVPKTAQDIEDALARAREIDAEVAAKRQGASFAGDADPYRQPRADDSEDRDDGDEPEAADGTDEPDDTDQVTRNAE